MKTAEEKRLAVIAEYKTILDRNEYSQSLRNYCFKKYSDGKYYSDCSSSISYCYAKAGFGFGILTTVGMWETKKMKDVNVKIKNGIIENPEVLHIGDMLLFAGNDVKRKPFGYVGHVEMVAEINNNSVIIYGHTKGKPKIKDINEFCKMRYESKTDTPIGNKGLIRVRRFILHDSEIEEKNCCSKNVVGIATALQDMNIRKGPDTKYDSISIINKGTQVEVVELLNNGWLKIKWKYGDNGYAFTSNKNEAYYLFNEIPKSALDYSHEYKKISDSNCVGLYMTTGNLNMRTGPGIFNESIIVIPKDCQVECEGIYSLVSNTKWFLVKYNNNIGYCSEKFLIKK